MIGKHHAVAIFLIDLVADLVLDGALSLGQAQEHLVKRFPRPTFESVPQDFALELTLTMEAPKTEDFPPTAAIAAIKPEAWASVASRLAMEMGHNPIAPSRKASQHHL